MTRKTAVESAKPETGRAGAAPSGRRIWHVLAVAATVTVFGASLWVLHREISDLEPGAILAHARAIPLRNLLAAGAFTACSYLVLTGYDALALRYAGSAVRYRDSARTAFVAFAVGHNVGVAALSGGSVRYRMYSLLGLSGIDITRVIVFGTLTFALGASLLLGAALLLMPQTETVVLGLPHGALAAAGTLLLAFPVGYLIATVGVRAPLTVGKWALSLPSPGIGLAQVVLAVADLGFAAASIYVILEPDLHIGYPTFLGIYLIAIAAGLLSSVPGGIGVFEAVLLLALPGVDRGVLLGTVVVYRMIYYVAPLSLALALLAGNEFHRHRQAIHSTTRRTARWLSAATPQIFGLAVFLAGAVLLVSGSTPSVQSRIELISRFVPLPLLELSHLAGSVVGVGLLILARGLFRRLRSACLAALALLGAGIVASLTKGLDFEEACILLVVLALLWVSRGQFYRRGSVAAESFSPGWVVSIALVIGFAVWVGFISYRHQPYSQELWWQFAFHSDAPRALRASLLAGLAATSLALWKVLRPGPPGRAQEAGPAELERVRAVVRSAPCASANAALTGDKRFLWSSDGQGFVMYQVSGDHWIALGDPVAPAAEREGLAWAFRELVDRHDGRPVFYGVSDASLYLYVDMGLALAKLGEEAWVSLNGFSLEGSAYAEIRQALNRARRQGATFTIVPARDVGDILADLRAVSDEWMTEKSTSEKGFSLGHFSEAYLRNFDCAVIRVGGRIVAFANLWAAPAGAELSVDLMRHGRAAPKGVMDYLFAELLAWGKSQGFHWFNLGMAPLSGLERHELAPLWHRLGHLVFTHGEAFYNFEGLRHYKEKFHPEWRPRYIACPGGPLSLPRALLEASRLIAGSAAGIVRKG